MPDEVRPTPVACEGDLRDMYPQVSQLARDKALPRLDGHCRRFIAMSPFLCLGTSRADGAADVSPRGDAPGFVRVVDDTTLLLPDRPGNNRLDSLSNVLANPNVGLLFFIPGFEETLRVNGTAEIVTDPALLADMAVNGKVPRSALKVTVAEAFLHCAKALKRSRLWSDDYRQDRRVMPGLGTIIVEQTKAALDPDEADRLVEDGYATKLY